MIRAIQIMVNFAEVHHADCQHKRARSAPKQCCRRPAQPLDRGLHRRLLILASEPIPDQYGKSWSSQKERRPRCRDRLHL